MGTFPTTPRRVNPDGSTNIYCRQCGRIVARAINPMFRTVSKCLICEGYPEEQVLLQYSQLDPTKPPVPIGQEDPVFIYEEEREAAQAKKPWTGMLKPLFRMLGIDKYRDGEEEEIATKPKPEPRSKKVAKAKKSGGLFERD